MKQRKWTADEKLAIVMEGSRDKICLNKRGAVHN